MDLLQTFKPWGLRKQSPLEHNRHNVQHLPPWMTHIVHGGYFTSFERAARPSGKVMAYVLFYRAPFGVLFLMAKQTK